MTSTAVSRASAVAFAAALLLPGCGAQHDAAATVPAGPNAAGSTFGTGSNEARAHSVIGHVIIIIQENRTTDNLFHGLKGADTVDSGMNSLGQEVPLHAVRLEARYDLGHSHPLQVTEYDNGKMDGFDLDHVQGYCKYLLATCEYAYVPKSEVKPYFDLATQYAFADRMFESNEGPSFPAHQYLISGTSTTQEGGNLKAADNPYLGNGGGGGGGCDAPKHALVDTIDPSGFEGNPVFPCFDRPTLGDVLDAKGVSWRYYQMELGPGLWHPFDAIRHIRYGPDNANIVYPSQKILDDITQGKLAQVSWVTPAGANSDHAGSKGNGGPAWVASIVNAIGGSQYWNDSAIFILWDDPGGWYDHVAPPVYNSYELGFRVPMIIVSPYAKRGYVSHTQYEFGSILKFVEDRFQTQSLDTTDVRANSVDDAFKFNSRPRGFVRIAAPPFRIQNDAPDSD
jgi:phospholipase C